MNDNATLTGILGTTTSFTSLDTTIRELGLCQKEPTL
jgi:hypothetical protein